MPRKRTRPKPIDKTILYDAVSNSILLSLSEDLGELACVTLETFNNILQRIRTVSPAAAERLTKEWKTYIATYGPFGLKIREAEAEDQPSSHNHDIPWSVSLLKCRHSKQHSPRYNSTSINTTKHEIEQLINLIPSTSSAEKLVTILDALFTLKLNGETFKQALRRILHSLLAHTCKTVNAEHYFATGARLDLYVKCPNAITAFEIKTPEEGTASTASHSPLQQARYYVELLKNHYSHKPVAVIVIRTDGKTPTDMLAAGLREDIDREIRKAIHVLSKDNLKPILKAAKRITKEEKDELTAEKLLELIAEGRIDTIRLAVQNLYS